MNDVITRYTGLVESARSNNRLGFPLGAAYLRQATNLLRTDALPPLEDLGKTEQARIAHSYSASAHAMYWLVAGLVVALAVLIVAQVWLAGRTRRLFNLPLVTATAAVLVVGLVLVGLMAWSQSKANKTRSNAYFATVELATARIDAFDAKSAESLTLIARGSGGAYDANYKDLAANAGAILKDAAEPRRHERASRAEGVHRRIRRCTTEIRAADNNGDWDGAVAIATGTKPTDANAVFSQVQSTRPPRHSISARPNCATISARRGLRWRPSPGSC